MLLRQLILNGRWVSHALRPALSLILCSFALCGVACAVDSAWAGGAGHAADSLLSVDLNRQEIVGRLMTQWQADVAAPQRESFKVRLAGLRADRLLAVSLVGSFDGVLHVLYGQEKADQAAINRTTLSALSAFGTTGTTPTRNRQKALGDANIDLVYTPLTPCRLFDTRTGQSSALGTLGGIFSPNTRRSISPAGGCGVPDSGLKSLVMGVTTRNSTPGSGGYIAVVAPAAGISATVDIFNLGAEWSATNIIAPTSASGQFDVYVAQATADVVMDVVGYFAPPPQPIGDITEVNTGTATTTGLTGGVTSGIATLSLSPGFKLPQGCADNQIAKWSGSVWICAADDAGPANAFVQGGNAFGAPAVIGTTDAQPVTVQSGGSAVNLLTARGDGLRIAGRVSGASSPSTINGNRLNSTLPGVLGATIAGGGLESIVNEPNTVSGNFGTVGGGSANTAGNNGTVAGGIVNVASGSGSSVAGGNNNTASGSSSVVAGGLGNTASGDYSFAAGRRASADRDGAFVWADSRLFGFSSSATWPGTGGVNSFSARATGGVTFVTAITGSGATLNECYLNGGSNVGTGWNCTSDRNAKERVTPISPKRVLEQLVAMPVSTWSIIGSSLRQMGPMAQDFYQAFGLGDTDRAINSVNANGVAFAAIQGLNQKLTAQGTVIRAKKVEIAKLKANAATLAARLAAIEKKLGL